MKKILYILLFLPLIIFGQEQDPCYSINDVFNQISDENPPLEINLVSGWNIIGYPCSQEIMVSSAFSSIIDNVLLVKNNSGSVFIPEFNFNEIGFLEAGQGYKIKMDEIIIGFSFCQSIQLPSIDGCTDCEAANFNQWANSNDDSCNYDSDGDGIDDDDEVLGCQDSNACNFNELATDSGECSYPQNGYDCDGNITAQIGDQIEGGYLFYLDETEQYGLVTATEDLDGTYEWGCYNEEVGSNGIFIGTGYQNTMDIVNQGCATENGGITAAQAALDAEINGYSDWYLPSKDDIIEVYNNIGQGADNIGNFTSNYWCSTEVNSSTSYKFSFTNNTIANYDKINFYKVRPIRTIVNWTMGCMDETACNYNSEANMADGTCTYSEQGYDCDGNITAQIGDQIEGGYLFYLDETGQHGLVSALEDITEGSNIGSVGGGEGFQWGCYNQTISGADGEGIGTGYQNTLDIVAHNCETQNGGITAVQSTLNYSFQGFTDWYLPSKEELQEMYNTIGNAGLQGNIGGFDLSRYWSSTEIGNTSAVTVSFNDGGAYNTNGYFFRRVRAVRTF